MGGADALNGLGDFGVDVFDAVAFVSVRASCQLERHVGVQAREYAQYDILPPSNMLQAPIFSNERFVLEMESVKSWGKEPDSQSRLLY